MDRKRRLFIYDRKEVGVLILLGVGVALFAFTLGVHLGKQVVPKAIEAAGEAKPVDPLTTAETQAPSRVEISQEVKNVPAAVDETLDQSLRDEIAKTGMKVDKTRQLELPKNVHEESSKPEVGANEHATENAEPKTEKKVAKTEPKVAAESAGSRYTLQVGSYPSLHDAEPVLLRLNENGLRAEVREVELAGKGKWFRLFVGQFDSVKDAEKAGKSFKKERRIAEFVVVKAPASTSQE
ncbi:MAG: SPOR domain-containing protein [Bdellovibrionales bacterium]|nr:SPOR domain-containing protein [Bdellovibrionales bacterium]